MSKEIDRTILRFVPERLLGSVASGPELGLQLPGGSFPTLARRVPVTVLFADLSGFTSLSERLDPEQVAALLDRFFELVDRACSARGGQLDKFLGDACQVIFPEEEGAEPAAMRAARAALAVQAAMPSLGSANDLRCTCTVESGEAVLALLSGEERSELAVIGPVVGATSELQKRCAPGEIVIGVAASAALDLRELDAQLEPYGQDAYRLRPAAQARWDEPGLFGRSDELHAIDAAVERLRDGRGTRLLFVGSDGSGRSRLLAVMRSRAGKRGIESLLLRPAGDAPGALLRRLLADAVLLGEPERGRLVTAAIEAIGAQAGSCPFVLALDDLDRIDAPSRQILEEVAAVLANRGCLVAASSRTALPGWNEVAVGELAEFDATRLLATLAPERAEDRPWLEEQVRRRGALPGELFAAAGRTEALLRQWEELPAAHAALVRTIAELGPVDPDLAVDVTLAEAGAWDGPIPAGRPEVYSGRELVRRLCRSGLLDLHQGVVSVASPDLAEALRWRLAPETAELLHRLAAAFCDARGAIDEALHHRTLAGEPAAAVEARLLLAERYLAFGCIAEAQGQVRSASILAQRERLTRLLVRVRILEGRILRAQGEFEEAAAALLAAHGAAARADDRVEAALALASLFGDKGREGLVRDCLARAEVAAQGDDALLRRILWARRRLAED